MTTPQDIAREKLRLAEECDLSQVRYRFAKEFEATAQDAEAAERELIRYFVLGEALPERDHGMFGGCVDAYWHTFLVFTMPYVDFCKHVFGYYIHHVPEPPPTDGAGTGDQALASAETEPDLTFADFAADYATVFGEPLPDLWRERAPKPRALSN